MEVNISEIDQNFNIFHLNLLPKNITFGFQLFSIVDCVFDIMLKKCFNKTKNIIIVEDFVKNFSKGTSCSIEKILDITHMNSILKNYNIVLITNSKPEILL